ncbi:hypothetical protein ABIA25_006452 [Sinorhizobium fredii]
MTITANFLTGPRLIVAGSRFAAVFGPFGLALSAKRLAMPKFNGLVQRHHACRREGVLASGGRVSRSGRPCRPGAFHGTPLSAHRP